MYSKWTEQKYLLSKCSSSSKLLTKVFHILKVCHFKTHVVHIEPWNPKFVSAKKSVGKTEKGRKPGESAEGGRVAGSNLEGSQRKGQSRVRLDLWVWWPGKELSQWIVKGERQLMAGRAKREYGKLSTSHHESRCTEWLCILWWAVLKNERENFQPSPPSPSAKSYWWTKHSELQFALCVDRNSLEQTGQVTWHSTQCKFV